MDPIRIVPFTEQATEDEAPVLRMMVYLAAVLSLDTEIGGSIELHNEAFEEFERILEELDGDPDNAVELRVEDGYVSMHPSDRLKEVAGDLV